MTDVFTCSNEGRLQTLRGQSAVNGIDYLVVVDGGTTPDTLRQRVLLVRLVVPVADTTFDTDIGATHAVQITGGTRVVNPAVRWVRRLATLDTATIDPDLSNDERDYLDDVAAAATDADHWLAVMVENYGDHSTYRLALGDGAAPPADFDPLLSAVAFTFKAECPSPFDCVRGTHRPTTVAAEPELDYLARDFPSFRQLMFDRLALTAPDDQSREAATLRAALVEAVAYEADRLAYFQDAVATEAYLTTARTRPSVRRHSRLLGYPMHDGCNSRGYVQLLVADGVTVGGAPVEPGATLFTRLPFGGAAVAAADLLKALAEAPESFEVRLAPATFTAAHNDIAIYTWGDSDCCLDAGATAVWLEEGPVALALAPGDFLLLRQSADPVTLDPIDADPALRHVVRLTTVGEPVADPLFPGTAARLVEWAVADALPFRLLVSSDDQAVAGAAANLVLVDHGRTVTERIVLERWGVNANRKATLSRTDLGWSHWPPADERQGLAAVDWLDQDPRRATAHVTVVGEGESWAPVRDLLASPGSAREFVVETERDGRARLRFGDDVHGRRPSDEAVAASQLGLVDNDDEAAFRATYRVGNGTAGNVGAGAIAHLVVDPSFVDAALGAALVGVVNPIPTRGGQPPETIAEVRRDAPQAFRVQERAVTVADWVEVAERHPRVQRARASLRWTGSWHTVFVTVDPLAGVDFDTLRGELLATLDRYRLAGHDLQVVAPQYVPLDIALTVCIEASAYRDQVELALREEFTTTTTADGRLGFFHPDRFTFGDSVWLSQVIARCMAVPGVRYVDVRSTANANRFKRRGRPQGAEVDDGRIHIADVEIARCDSDPNAPEMGTIEFFIEGGS
jgi:hypothetical protein